MRATRKRTEPETQRSEQHRETTRGHDAVAPLVDGAQRSAGMTPQQALALQRTVGNAAAARIIQRSTGAVSTASTRSEQTIQRYTMAMSGGLGNSRRSQTGRYLLQGNAQHDATAIWVMNGAPVPLYCQATANAGVIGGVQYQEYEPTGLFLADCLHTAEEIMAGQTLQIGQDVSQVAGAGAQFGVSNRDNVDAATAYDAARVPGQGNGMELPAVGESFAIVETDWTRANPNHAQARPRNASRWPYHAAAVIAEDGNDRITLEQTAGAADAQPGHGEEGIFDIYQAGQLPGGASVAKSFHGRHGPSFSVGAITITLQPMPPGPAGLIPDAVPR